MRLPRLKVIIGTCIALLLTGCDTPPPLSSQWLHSEGSYSASFSANGEYLLAASTDAAARLWNLSQNQIQYSWQSEANETGSSQLVAFAANNQRAATVEYDTVMLWDIDNGEPQHRLTFPYRVEAIDLSLDGAFLLLSLANSTAVYFDINANRVLQIFEHDGAAVNSPVRHPINSVAISPDGKTGLTGGDDRTARLWDLDNGELIHRWIHSNGVNLVEFEPQGRFAVTAAHNAQTHLRALPAGDLQATLRSSPWPASLPLPNFPVFNLTTTAVNFSADGTLLVTGHANERVCIWQLPDGAKLDCWKVPRQNKLRPGVVIQAVAFTDQDRQILSVGGNGLTQHWQWR